ncbi:MAG: tetratricopeptide repeat protein [Myxococcales bacterium]
MTRMQTPTRWKDAETPPPGDQAPIAALVRRLKPTPEQPEPDVDRLVRLLQRNVLDRQPPRPQGAWGAWLRRRWRLWVVGLSALLGLNVALAIALLFGSHRQPTRAPAPVATAAAVPAPAPTPAPPETASIAPASAPPPRETRRLGRPRAAGPAPAAAAPEDAALVAAALRDLAKGDAQEALARAGGYLDRHPAGLLRGEAELARLQALLLLGKRAEAAALLDGFAAHAFVGLPRSQELRVLRGELLTEQGRFAEALRSFDGAGAEADPALRERALFGRALCRARLGDAAGSREDFERYLELFPEGAHAKQARGALGAKTL